ncbi:MAG: hypothetical protein ABIN18_09530 [Pseudomonadota bacterium]
MNTHMCTGMIIRTHISMNMPILGVRGIHTNTPTSTPMIIPMNTNMSTGIVVIRTCTTMITQGTTDLTIMTIPDMMRKLMIMIINN